MPTDLRDRIAKVLRENYGRPSWSPEFALEAADLVLAVLAEDGFYERFCDEVDRLVIRSDATAAAVVGELTRAAKRAEMGLLGAVVSGASHKVEQPRAATVDIDPQDAAASLGELSLPAKDGAGLPVTGASEGATDAAV